MEQQAQLPGQPITAFIRALCEHPDGDAVATAVGAGLLAPFDPVAVAIHIVRPRTGDFELSGQWGMPADVVDDYELVPSLLPSPLRDVSRSGVEAFLPLRKVAKDFPVARPYVTAHPADAKAQVAFLPLRRSAVTVGVVSIRFPQPVARTWPFREALDVLTSSLTLWVLAYAAAPAVARRGHQRSPLTLTTRQRSVLELVRDGRTNAEIARRLGFSEVTIKADLTSLYKVLGARGRAELVERAAEAGL